MTAIVAQIPVCGQAAPTLEPTRANFDAIRASLLSGDVAGGPDVTLGPLPVVSPDQLGTPSLLEPVQAYRWFIDHGARHGTGWVNRVTRVLPDTPVPYSPVLCAPFVTPPTLMIAAPDDEMPHANYDVALLAHHLMPDPKEWHDIAGGLFGLAGDLLDELGVAGCGPDDQERAVKQWLADNEPDKVLALSLREDGFLDANVSNNLSNEPRRTGPDDGGRTPSGNAADLHQHGRRRTRPDRRNPDPSGS